MNSIITNIKHLFLSFAQEYFANYAPLRWDYDAGKTNVIIADKTATDIGIAARRPSIILSRGDFGWMYVTRGQDGRNVQDIASLMGKEPSAGYFSRSSFTDLLRGSVSFNVLSKNGNQTERMAEYLYTGITGYQEEFKKRGIFKFNGLNLGSEQMVRAGTEIELVGVTIDINFITQQIIVKENKYNNISIFVNEDSNQLSETIDFSVINNGTQIQILTELNSTDRVYCSYRDAITLGVVSNIELSQGDNSNVYTIPNAGKVLAYYHLWSNTSHSLNGLSLYINNKYYYDLFDFSISSSGDILTFQDKSLDLLGQTVSGYNSERHSIETQVSLTFIEKVTDGQYIIRYN